MAKQQFYGITYPFSNDSVDEYFVDLNDSYVKGVQSCLFHLLFTPKGQRLREPDFGCDLSRYLFDPNDESTLDEVKGELETSIKKYVPEVTLDDISVIEADADDYSKILTVEYSVRKPDETIKNKVSIKL